MTQRAGNGSMRLRRVSYSRCFSSVLALFLIACIDGCGGASGSGGTPEVDPAAAAEQAIELYDKNANGTLDESELAASPGLFAARDRYDTDGDGQISEGEIGTRFTNLFGAGTPWLTVHCQIVKGGRPLAGAKVRFVPEPFLGETLLPAVGTTDSQGRVNPAVAEEYHPENLKGRNIMQPGVYRVEIEHANVNKPHKPLGCEIDDFARGGTEPVIRL
jgi:hypothetical protein